MFRANFRLNSKLSKYIRAVIVLTAAAHTGFGCNAVDAVSKAGGGGSNSSSLSDLKNPISESKPGEVGVSAAVASVSQSLPSNQIVSQNEVQSLSQEGLVQDSEEQAALDAIASQ